MRAFKTLLIAFAMIALAHPAMAQTDPHHPTDAETAAAPGEADTTGPKAPADLTAGCPGMTGMMGMMQMMQSMQTMQMEMMQQMLEMQRMQKGLAASPDPTEEKSP